MDLIVGGAGFVGSHLVKALVEQGRTVRVLDAFARRPADDGSRMRRQVKRFPAGVQLVEGDVRESNVLDQAVHGVRRVIHLGHAVGSRLSLTRPSQVLETNVLGTQALLEAMERHRVSRLVLVSSAQVYGRAPGRPSRESDPLLPCNPFGASMVAAEALAAAWQSVTRGSVAIVRPTTVYGPRMRPDSALYRFVDAVESERSLMLFGDGRARRDHVHVQDVVRVLLAARRVIAEDRPAVFNACSGVATSLLDVVQAIRFATDKRAAVECLPAAPGDPDLIWADPAETARQLGVSAEIGLDQGIDHVVRWHRQRATPAR